MVNKQQLISLTLGLALLIYPAITNAALPNKNAIISQDETLYNGVTDTNIQQYFNQTQTQLATYTIPADFDVYYPIGQGQWDKVTVHQTYNDEVYYGKTVAQLVYEFATTDRSSRVPPSPGKMNPLIALATIDKESASITGSYKSNIVTDHPITLSWMMGYGFDGTMANCINNGVCDVNYNLKQAQFYGGPGQQLAEGVSALKRWSTNPTPLNVCGSDSTNWRQMSVGGECLNLENSISYALYRYTPTFSGNDLFRNLYNAIKAAFPFPSSGSQSYTGTSDVANYTLDTYNARVTINGTKRSDRVAAYGSTNIADIGSTTWQVDINPEIGKHDYVVQYNNSSGQYTGEKKIITINRHKSGDINGDTSVDILDLSLLSNYWGHTSPDNTMVDVNGDNVVDILDLSLIANNWAK